MRGRVGIPFIALLVAQTLCVACSGEPAATGQGTRPGPAGPGEGILFIGNSLTDANDLPGMVEALATAAGQKLPTAQVAFGGYSLGDQLRQGDASRAIATGGWRVVVLQQGPSGQLDSRADGFHPSEEGSYLAALAIVGVLAPASPQGLPARFARPSGRTVSIAAADASVLQDAAATAIVAYARR